MAYNDMYQTFDDTVFQYYYPISFDLRNKSYLVADHKPSATWHYGENVSITFNINSDVDISLTNFNIEVLFYNFRHELIYKEVKVPNGTDTVVVSLTSETSSNIFKKGIYYCQLQLVGQEDTANEGDIRVLLNSEDCILYVE